MDTFNRVLWWLAALALIGMGTVGLLAGTGVFGHELQTETLPAAVAAQFEHPDASTALGLGLAGLAALALGVLLLKAEVSIPRADSLPNLRISQRASIGPRAGGVTVVRGAALRRGLERDLERIRGVKRATALLVGPLSRPHVRARLNVAPDADHSQVRAGVRQVLERLASTTGRSPATVDITVHVQEARRWISVE